MPLRIIVVQETDWLKRGPHQQHHLFERLAARGHAITALDFEILYTPGPRAPLLAPRQQWDSVTRSPIKSPGVTVIRPATTRLLPLARPLSLVTFYIELTRLCRASKPDVIVDYALSTGLPALMVARRCRVPFLFHVSGLLRLADRTLYINEELRQYGVQCGANAKRASMIRTGVDLQRFHPGLDAS